MEELPIIEREETLENQNKFLKEKVDEISERYGLKRSEHYHAEMNPELNKVFLAMLDEYLSKSGYQFSNEQDFITVDFGSGNFQYYEGYKTFFEKYKINNEEKRKVEIIQWDSSDGMAMTGSESIICDVYINVSKENKEETQKFLKEILKQGERDRKLKVVTMFAMGPGMFPIDPEEVDNSFVEAISQLSDFMEDGAVLILTTSFGGAKKQPVLSALQEAGLKVILNEKNKYEDLLLEAHSGFTHEDIIIAIKE